MPTISCIRLSQDGHTKALPAPQILCRAKDSSYICGKVLNTTIDILQLLENSPNNRIEGGPGGMLCRYGPGTSWLHPAGLQCTVLCSAGPNVWCGLRSHIQSLHQHCQCIELPLQC